MCSGQDAWIDEMVTVMTKNLDWFQEKYEWGKKSESETTKVFATYSKQIQDLLKVQQGQTKGQPLSLEQLIQLGICINEIVVKWGGINNAPIPEFCIKIKDNIVLFREMLECDFQISRDFIDRLLNNDDRISSWSKILSTIAPGKFFIYDSRVSIALSFFSKQTEQSYFWKLLPPKGQTRKEKLRKYNLTEEQKNQLGDAAKEDQAIRTIIQAWNLPQDKITKIIEIYRETPFEKFKSTIESHRGENPEADIPTSYFQYHQLLHTLAQSCGIKGAYQKLRNGIKTAYQGNDAKTHQANFTLEQAIMAHIEKMLFMMKEKILALPEYNRH